MANPNFADLPPLVRGHNNAILVKALLLDRDKRAEVIERCKELGVHDSDSLMVRDSQGQAPTQHTELKASVGLSSTDFVDQNAQKLRQQNPEHTTALEEIAALEDRAKHALDLNSSATQEEILAALMQSSAPDHQTIRRQLIDKKDNLRDLSTKLKRHHTPAFQTDMGRPHIKRLRLTIDPPEADSNAPPVLNDGFDDTLEPHVKASVGMGNEQSSTAPAEIDNSNVDPPPRTCFLCQLDVTIDPSDREMRRPLHELEEHLGSPVHNRSSQILRAWKIDSRAGFNDCALCSEVLTDETVLEHVRSVHPRELE